jgi:hypothetical protein
MDGRPFSNPEAVGLTMDEMPLPTFLAAPPSTVGMAMDALGIRSAVFARAPAVRAVSFSLSVAV